MPFDWFRFKVETYARATGLSIKQCAHDGDRGLHIAQLSDGSVITGNTINKSVTMFDEYRNHCIQYTPAHA